MPAPASEGDRLRLSGESTKWLVAAVLPLVMAGGYWAFSQNSRHKLEQSRGSVGTEQIRERETLSGPQSAGKAAKLPEAEAARPELLQASEPAPEPSDALRSLGEPLLRFAVAPPGASRPLVETVAVTPTSPEGLYGGPICYGPAAVDPPRCFRAQGSIEHGRIAARWPSRDPGLTMLMAGEVSASGEAKIHIDAMGADGARAVAIEMSGTLRDGRLDAAGSFRDGRTATLSWRKSGRGSR